MADEEEAVTAAVPLEATKIIVEVGLISLRFDLHPGRLGRCRLREDQVNIRLVLSEDAAALPAASREYQVDQRFEIPPVELPYHMQANASHLGPNGDRLPMERVRFAADTPQEIIGMLDGANRHLVAGGAVQGRTEAAHVKRLAVQACLGPACPGSTTAGWSIEIPSLKLDHGPGRKSPPKMSVGHRDPQGIVGQTIEFL
jgi:hypothetical protein